MYVLEWIVKLLPHFIYFLKPSQNKNGQKIIQVFAVFFYSWQLNERHQKWCTWNFFWPFWKSGVEIWSGIDVGQGINVGHGKKSKINKHRAYVYSSLGEVPVSFLKIYHITLHISYQELCNQCLTFYILYSIRMKDNFILNELETIITG